jgi:nucleotidyltransferase substrate binding protein (TIGR01987 family)
MHNKKEIRWKQRFTNFEKAFKVLERTVQIQQPNEAEKGGLIQFYEVCFELSWKTMKDYLESEGYIVKSPKQTIKQAFQIDLIQNGELWLTALEDRNLTSHTYDETTINMIVKNITDKYFPLLKDLYEKLKNEQ